MTQHSYQTEYGAADVEEISAEEELARLDAEARRVLNVSGEEFRAKWLAGEYREHDDPRVAHLAMLLPDAW